MLQICKVVRTNAFRIASASALVSILASAVPAQAQLALSANDNKSVLVDGVPSVVSNPAADTVSFIDMNVFPPKLIGEIKAPSSVVGPPLSVAINADESLALIAAAMKINPADPTKSIPDNKVSVIDLKATPPAVIATLETGAGAAGVSFNRAGTLALVANRSEGTVSVLSVNGKSVSQVGKLKLGTETSGPSHVVFTPDGKSALVTRDGDNTLTLLAIDGQKVESKRDFAAGLRPYGLDMSSDGKFAVVANIGRNLGDADTISLIDMQSNPVKVVDTVTAGPTPEGILFSPDGKTVAVVIHNGSGKPKASPLFNEHGKLVLFRVDGARLVRYAEAPIGKWSQGVAFSKDGSTILVQNMVERDIQVFRLQNGTLRDSGTRIQMSGGPAAIRTAR